MRWSVVTIFVVIAASAAYLTAAPDGNSLQEASTAKFNAGPTGPIDDPPLDPTSLPVVRRPEIVTASYGLGAILESKWNYKDRRLHAPGFGPRLGASLLQNSMTGQFPRQLTVGEKATDQVVSMLGQPDRKATVGPKEIYFYKI
jgi:hypothetical protein